MSQRRRVSRSEQHERPKTDLLSQTTGTERTLLDEPADHGLTHSDTEPKGGQEALQLIHVQPGRGGGVLVRWDATHRKVLVAPAATTVEGNWTKAARLIAHESARAVQLTILSAAFRVYVDGQRLARVGSPVLVRASQRVAFAAAEGTLYAFVPSAASAAPRVHRSPLSILSTASSELGRREGRGGRHSERTVSSTAESRDTFSDQETAEVIALGRGADLQDNTRAADLIAEASADTQRRTLDVMESVLPAHAPVQRASDGRHPTPHSDAQETRQRTPERDAAGVFNGTFVWGRVTTVRSPDWAALAALYRERSLEAGSIEEGEEQEERSWSSPSDFAAAMRSRRRRQERSHSSHAAGQGGGGAVVPPPPRPRHPESTGSDGTTVSVERHPVREGGRSRSFARLAEMLDPPDDSLCNSDASHARSIAELKATLRLPQRVMVVPFVVENFGASHRYRPITLRSGGGQQAEKEGEGEGGDVSLPSESGSESSEQRYGAAPWRFPQAADELTTPRSEGVVRRTLGVFPGRTRAAKDASFLHDALRRTYDATTDRFTYFDSPELPGLLCTTFMTVSAELIERLRESRPVPRLTSPLVCAGDLHGSFKDLLRILGSVAHFTHWSMQHTPLVLLGNYVDYGWHSVEVVLLLCSWACLQPTLVHFLRGTHEDPCVNGDYATLRKRCLRYKCRQRFGARQGRAVWQQMNRVFALLPVAAVVDSRAFLVHGGVPQLLPTPIRGDDDGGDRRRGILGFGASRRHLRRHGAMYSNTSGVPTPTSTNTNASAVSSLRLRHSPVGSEALWTAENLQAAAAPLRTQPVVYSTVDSQRMALQARSSDLQQIACCPNEELYTTYDYSSDYSSGGDVGGPGGLRAMPSSCFSGADAVVVHRKQPTVATKEKMRAPFFTHASSPTVLSRLEPQPRMAGSVPSTSWSSSFYFSGTSPPPHRSHGDVVAGQPPCAGDGHAPYAAAAGAAVASAPTAASSIADGTPADTRPVPGSTTDSQPVSETSATPPVRVVPARQSARARPSGCAAPLAPAACSSSYLTNSSPLSAVVIEGNSEGTRIDVEAEHHEASPNRPSSSCLDTTFSMDAASHRSPAPQVPPIPSHASAFSSQPVEADDDTPTEADFERLLLASTMSDYTFSTLQPLAGESLQAGAGTPPTADAAGARRRRRLLRELVWNRPRDTLTNVGLASVAMPERVEVVEGAVQPAWWQPHAVECCRGCGVREGEPHACCLVYGRWGLLSFLHRFSFALVLRGAPEDAAEMYGALLAEEGRLLSLLSCTRLRRAPLQAAACVLRGNALQFAVWGAQELADSNGQVSLSELPGVRERRVEPAEFCRFVGEQIHARMTDHGRVGPLQRWGVVSAYGEFTRQRAVKKRLGLN